MEYVAAVHRAASWAYDAHGHMPSCRLWFPFLPVFMGPHSFIFHLQGFAFQSIFLSSQYNAGWLWEKLAQGIRIEPKWCDRSFQVQITLRMDLGCFFVFVFFPDLRKILLAIYSVILNEFP